MIITVQKDINDILKALEKHRGVYVVGCAACATKCQTGGEEAVKRISGELAKAGKSVTGSVVLDTPCDMRIAKRDLAAADKDDATEVLLLLACGAGIQAVEKVTGKPLVPALDPVFAGTTERIGIYHAYCELCGNCILGMTAGICPVSRCTKGLVNGPCGGAVGGKCEADQEKDCAWALIFEKLRKTGKGLAEIERYQPPRTRAKPGRLDARKRIV